MKRSAFRLLPAVASFVLLAFATFAPALRAREAAPAASDVVGCNVGALAGTDGTKLIGPTTGVLQPFDGTVAVQSCSLAVDYTYYSNGRFSIDYWDPLLLMPDPTTVALRSRNYNASELQYNHVRFDFGPLVVQSVAGVAERGRTLLAADYFDTDYSNAQNVHFWIDGPVGMPSGYSYTTPMAIAPMPGPHPVLGVSLCPADPGDADLRVVQSVVTTTSLNGFAPYEYLQRFRVPVRVDVRQFELPFGSNNYVYPSALGLVAIADAQAYPAPTASPFPTLTQANFFNIGLSVAQWATHYDFDQSVTLLPNHDYWLLVRAANTYPMWIHDITGSEGPDFAAGIGEFYERDTPAGAWIPQSGKVLPFRLIGTPIVPLAVTPALGRGLRVGIEPNPARGAAIVRWSGASGNVRFEVLDPRGRRVSSVDASGAEGTWMWRGGGDDGQPFAPGVYFVRAVDASGASGVTRVVLLR
jgi:hypothetical protein